MASLVKYLITATDIKTYRPTAVLDDVRVQPFILVAQRLDLRPVLNDALYYDFLTKFDEEEDDMYAAYQNLLVGDDYTYNAQTIQFDGVKAMLSCFALARFVAANPVNITRMGITVKQSDQSTPADASLIRMTVNELRSAGMEYQNQLVQYLETMASTYPLYNTGGGSENAGRKASFNFFKL